MPTYAVILAAAGKSSRFKDPSQKKPFVHLNQKAVWLHSAELFLKRDDVKQLIVVISPEDKEDFLAKYGANLAVMGIDLVLGGAERADSVENGLAKVREEIDMVAIHDAARPCIHDEFIDQIFESAAQNGAAIPALPITGTVKKSLDGKQVTETIDRSHLYTSQTPQVFRHSVLKDLYARRGNTQPTDESQMAEDAGVPVAVVPGSPFNIKITSKQDLKLAAACLKSLPTPRFDAPLHPFADGDLWR